MKKISLPFQICTVYFPKTLAKLSKENNIQQFIHLSALGIEDVPESKYAMSKLNEEIEIRNNFHNHVILSRH